MTDTPEPKSEGLRALFWRDEILQVMFWIEGEGLGSDADPVMMERFLGLDRSLAGGFLDRLVEDGYLEHGVADRYRLSDEGRRRGARAFAEEFAEVTRPAHGECGPDCWCHASMVEAEACAADRAAS